MRLPSLGHAKTDALRAIASLTPTVANYAGGDKVIGRRVGASQDRAMLQRRERVRSKILTEAANFGYPAIEAEKYSA